MLRLQFAPGDFHPQSIFRKPKVSVTSHYVRLFWWQVLRDVRLHPLLGLLNVASVALGVAVYFAIQIANHSANRSFAATVDLVAGKAHLQVSAPASTLPDNLLPLVSAHPGVSSATPTVRGLLTLPDAPGEYLQLIGIDIFTDEPFRTFQLDGVAGQQVDIHKWLGDSAAIAVTEEFARKRGLSLGAPVRVQVNGSTRVLHVGAMLRISSDTGSADPHFAVMDIGWAQELLGRRGFLTSIDVRLTEPRDRETVSSQLRSLLPADAVVASPRRRSEQVETMLAGFQLNLTAMSLVSLLVGTFLIYNTVSASVLRRQRDIGILRSLGARRNEVRALFLAEAAVTGSLGIVLGLAGGYSLATFLVSAVSDTISSLYVLVSVRNLSVPLMSVATSALLGAASVLMGAWLPAHTAAAMNPVQALKPRAFLRHPTAADPAWLLIGACSLTLALGFSWGALATGPPWLGFVAAFFVLAGFSALAPQIAEWFGRAGSSFFSRAGRLLRVTMIEARLASGNLGRALMRNAVTIAALATAVAMSVGIAVMVFSFRETVGGWVNQTLVADLFVAPASNEVVGPASFIPREVIAFFQGHGSVAVVDTVRELDIPFAGRTVALAVISGSDRRNLRFVEGRGSEIMHRFYTEDCALVSESFARRFKMRRGSVVTLPTPTGKKRYPVAGVFFDYTRDQGVIFLNRTTFLRNWNDDRVNSAAVYLNPGAVAELLVSDFRQAFSKEGEFAIYSNRVLRSRIFEVFDQTFAVTYVLRTIAIIVATVGIFLSVTTLVTERSRELGILRAIGASRGQIQRMLLIESGMIGLLASGIGLAAGCALSVVLTGVINRAFFGWTIQLAFPWRSLAWTPAWITTASVLAAWLPARRAAHLPVAEALRNE